MFCNHFFFSGCAACNSSDTFFSLTITILGQSVAYLRVTLAVMHVMQMAGFEAKSREKMQEIERMRREESLQTMGR